MTDLMERVNRELAKIQGKKPRTLITGQSLVELVVDNGYITSDTLEALERYLGQLQGEASLFEILKEFIPESEHSRTRDFSQKAFENRPLKVFDVVNLWPRIQTYFTAHSRERVKELLLQQDITDSEEVFKPYLELIPKSDWCGALCKIFGVNKSNWPDWAKKRAEESET